MYGGIQMNEIQNDKINEMATEVINLMVSKSAFHSLLHELNEMESAIVAIRFGAICSPKSLQEVADLYQTTRETIRKVESNAMAKISKGTRERLANHRNAHHPSVLEALNESR